MKVPTHVQSILFATATSLLLTACGSSGVTGTPAASTLSQGNDNGGMYIPTIGNDPGAYPLSFKTVGKDLNGGISTPVVSMPLRTDTKFIVKATLGTATHNENIIDKNGNPVYSNYTANYSCATLRIILLVERNGTYVQLASVDTNRLTASGTSGCAGSVASQTIDFSPYMTSGHGNVKISVAAITSNVNCLQYLQYPNRYPYNYAAVCSNNPMQSIYQYHVVNGNLEVQVNGTDFVN